MQLPNLFLFLLDDLGVDCTSFPEFTVSSPFAKRSKVFGWTYRSKHFWWNCRHWNDSVFTSDWIRSSFLMALWKIGIIMIYFEVWKLQKYYELSKFLPFSHISFFDTSLYNLRIFIDLWSWNLDQIPMSGVLQTLFAIFFKNWFLAKFWWKMHAFGHFMHRIIISIQIFYTFPILPFKVEKSEAENSWNAPFFGNFWLPCLTSRPVKWKQLRVGRKMTPFWKLER